MKVKNVLILAALVALAVWIFKPKPEQKSVAKPDSPSELTLVISRLENNEPDIVVPESEIVFLVNKLLGAVNPDNPENSSMQPYMKERIKWLYRASDAKQLEIRPTAHFAQDQDGKENKATMMGANYDSEKRVYVLNLFTARLMTYARVQLRLPPKTLNETLKLSFAIMLAHEAGHMEQPPEFFIRNRSPQEWLEEEARVWEKINRLVIRPLRQQGVKVEQDFVQADEILKLCNDNPNHERFLNFLKGK